MFAKTWCVKSSLLTLFTVVSSEAGLTCTPAGDWVTAHRDLFALASAEAALAPVTRFTCCEVKHRVGKCSAECFRLNYVILSSATLNF